MKKLTAIAGIMILLLIMPTGNAFSQASFNKLWDSKFDNSPDYLRYTTSDGKYVVGSTKADMCVLDGSTGQKLWFKTFQDIAGVKKSKQQKVLEDAGMVLLVTNQKGNDDIFCLDIKTGNKIWDNTDYNDVDIDNIVFMPEVNSLILIMKKGLVFIDSKTGKEKGYVEGIAGVPGRWVFVPDKNEIVILCYQVNSLKAIGSGFKNHLLCIDAANIKLVWEYDIQGVVEIKRFASQTFSPISWAAKGVEKGIGNSDILVDLYVYNNKVLVTFNGLKVYDLANGTPLWSVDYDESLNRGLAGSSQMYNAVAAPLFTDNYVYLAAFEKGRDKALKKYDIETGKLIWETPIDGRKVIMPSLALLNGTIVVQIGGYVNLQGEQHSSSGTTYFSKWEWQGPFGLKGFDSETGKMIWQTEKFDNRITNILPTDNALYVADADNLYSVDLKSGNYLLTNSLKDLKIGKPIYLFDANNSVNVVTEDGIVSYNSTGKTNFSLKQKNVSLDNSVLWNKTYFLANDDVITALDLDSGKSIGDYKFVKGLKYGIKENGATLFLMGDKVSKYAIK